MFLAWERFYVVKALEKCPNMRAKAEPAIEDITAEIEKYVARKEELEVLCTKVTAVSFYVLIVHKINRVH